MAAIVVVILAVFILWTDSGLAAQSSAGLTIPGVKVNVQQRRRLLPEVIKIATRYRLDPALLDAVISVESGYNPRSVSSAGAQGLMQLMPATARRFNVPDPFDPVANIDAGARYLRLLIRKFGRINLALAAYHAGEGRVRAARNTIPAIPATRKYVIRVIHQFLRLKKRHKGKKDATKAR